LPFLGQHANKTWNGKSQGTKAICEFDAKDFAIFEASIYFITAEFVLQTNSAAT